MCNDGLTKIKLRLSLCKPPGSSSDCSPIEDSMRRGLNFRGSQKNSVRWADELGANADGRGATCGATSYII